MANKNSSNISVYGTVKNLLSAGFSLFACLCELIDNSLGSGATKIPIIVFKDALGKDVLVLSDNGKGMDKSGLTKAFKIAGRSDNPPSDENHGKFGVGFKYALATITQLKHTSITVSKTSSTQAHQVEVSWPEVLVEDSYDNKPTDITVTAQDKFLKVPEYSDMSNGTMHYIECDEKIAIDIRNGFNSKQIIDSYLYELGVTYYNYLIRGLIISINVDGKLYIVKPIDVIEWDKTTPENRTEMNIGVWSNEETICLLCKKNGKDMIYVNGSKKFEELEKIKNKTNYKGKDGAYVFSKEIFTYQGEITSRQVYNNTDDWMRIQIPIYDGIGQTQYKTNKQGMQANKKCQDTYNHMGGHSYTRNKKRIMRFPAEKPKSGDKNRYDYYTNTRQETMFTAQLDECFGVLINKLKLEENGIDKGIRGALKALHNEFAIKMFFKFNPKELTLDPVNLHSMSDTDSEDEHVIVHELEIAPVSAVVAKKVEIAPVSAVVAKKVEIAPVSAVVAKKVEIAPVSAVVAKKVDIIPNVSPSKQRENTRLCINQGLDMLKRLHETSINNASLAIIISDMTLKYNPNMSPAQIGSFFARMTLDQKYNTLLDFIKARYPTSDYDSKDIMNGAELYRAYIVEFPAQLIK